MDWRGASPNPWTLPCYSIKHVISWHPHSSGRVHRPYCNPGRSLPKGREAGGRLSRKGGRCEVHGDALMVFPGRRRRPCRNSRLILCRHQAKMSSAIAGLSRVHRPLRLSAHLRGVRHSVL